MKILNQNLPEHIFKIVNQTITDGSNSIDSKLEEGKKLSFVQLDKLENEDRILLRRMMTDRIDYVIIISSNPKIAQFAWKIGAFHFMDFPFTLTTLKILKHKVDAAMLTSKLVNKKIRLGFTGGYDFIPLNDISLILGQGDYITIYQQTTKAKTYTYRISKIEKALEHQLHFIKLTKSILININNVAQIIGNTVRFTGKGSSTIELSHRVIKTLKDELLWLNI